MNCKNCPKGRRPYKFSFSHNGIKGCIYYLYPVLTDAELKQEIITCLEYKNNFIGYTPITWQEYNRVKMK